MNEKIRSARANALFGLVTFTVLFAVGLAFAGVTGAVMEQAHTLSPAFAQAPAIALGPQVALAR